MREGASLLDNPPRISARRIARLGVAGVHHGARVVRGVLRRDDRGLARVAAFEARMAFQKLGPTYVKFGQIIASSPAFGDELVGEFAHCLDRVPAEGRDRVEAMLRAELGDLEDIFSDIDWNPIAAGSIAQVYRATTVKGDDVVIKVQRTGLRDVLRKDLRLMVAAARTMLRIRPSLRAANPVGVIEDFAQGLVDELNFVTEAGWMDELRHVLAPWPIRIPVVHHDLTTSRVLVMEYLEGVKISDYAGLAEMGVDSQKLIDTVFASVIYSACRHGVFHGDMHAGNILVMPTGEVGLLDFGIVGRLEGPLRVQVSELLQCLFEQQWDRMAPLCFEMADMTNIDMDAAVADLADIGDRYLGMPLSEMPLGEMTTEILQNCNRYGFVLPTETLLFFKSLLYLDGLGIRILPTYEVFSPENGLSLMRFLAPESRGAPAGENPTYDFVHVLVDDHSANQSMRREDSMAGEVGQ